MSSPLPRRGPRASRCSGSAGGGAERDRLAGRAGVGRGVGTTRGAGAVRLPLETAASGGGAFPADWAVSVAASLASGAGFLAGVDGPDEATPRPAPFAGVVRPLPVGAPLEAGDFDLSRRCSRPPNRLGSSQLREPTSSDRGSRSFNAKFLLEPFDGPPLRAGVSPGRKSPGWRPFVEAPAL